MAAVASVLDSAAIATAMFATAVAPTEAETDLVVLVASLDKAVVLMTAANSATAVDRLVAEAVAD